MEFNNNSNFYNQHENTTMNENTSTNTSDSYTYSNNDVPNSTNIGNTSDIGNGSNNNSTSSTVYNFLSNASLEPSTMKHRIGQITNKLKEIKNNNFSDTRNWYQFLGPERGKYQIPSFPDASNRIKENVVYFQTNYLIFFLVFAAYFVVKEPVFLFLLVLIFLISVYMHYLNPNLTDLQKRIGFGIQVFLSGYFILSAGHTIFWLLGASITVILLHASLHVPSALELKYGTSSDNTV